MASLSSYFQQCVDGVSDRSKDILNERFGMPDGNAKTLEEIGKKYGITRERIRQIIRSACRDIRNRHADVLREAERVISEAIRSQGGIVCEDDLFRVLCGDNKQEVSALSFFLECSLTIMLIKEDRLIKRSYAIEDFSLDRWKKIMREAVAFFKETKQSIAPEALADEISKRDQHIEREVLFHYLDVSKEIGENVFGKYGLANWDDIAPKGTREKAYLVLKSIKRPLHFREIAKAIDEHGLAKKVDRKTHPQTVHNELIKDTRFVLVGRGIYALSEWGYARGTVKDVVHEVLSREKAPMKRDEIIRRVLELRQVKKSTVVINLNTFFAKIGKDVYTLK